MPPGRWTALFFLDEATALAAGHRPCGYCRRPDFLDFAHAWQAAWQLPRRPWAAEMDVGLHSERTDRTRRKITYLAPVAGLPDAVMIRAGGQCGLLIAGRLRPWSPAGYRAADRRLFGTAEVLTPPSAVAAITAGYRPMVHPAAIPADLSGGWPGTVRAHQPRPPAAGRG